MNKAEQFLGHFVPHDPHACRFYQIIKYLRGAVAEYVQRRNRQWMERRSRQVDQLFGQVGNDSLTSTSGRENPPLSQQHEPQQQPPTVSSQASPDKLPGETPSSFATNQPTPQVPPLGNDVWDSLYNGADATALSYDAAISALTTSGIPVGCSPGGTIPPGAGQLPVSGGPSPLSDMIFPENGLLYMAEDLPMFGIWEDT
jgi:hypothetical protein